MLTLEHKVIALLFTSMQSQNKCSRLRHQCTTSQTLTLCFCCLFLSRACFEEGQESCLSAYCEVCKVRKGNQGPEKGTKKSCNGAFEKEQSPCHKAVKPACTERGGAALRIPSLSFLLRIPSLRFISRIPSLPFLLRSHFLSSAIHLPFFDLCSSFLCFLRPLPRAFPCDFPRAHTIGGGSCLA